MKFSSKQGFFLIVQTHREKSRGQVTPPCSPSLPRGDRKEPQHRVLIPLLVCMVLMVYFIGVPTMAFAANVMIVVERQHGAGFGGLQSLLWDSFPELRPSH